MRSSQPHVPLGSISTRLPAGIVGGHLTVRKSYCANQRRRAVGQGRKAQGSGPWYQEVSWVSQSLCLFFRPLGSLDLWLGDRALPILTPDSRGCDLSLGDREFVPMVRMECVSPDSARQNGCKMWTPLGN